jgi:hypothetical protein
MACRWQMADGRWGSGRWRTAATGGPVSVRRRAGLLRGDAANCSNPRTGRARNGLLVRWRNDRGCACGAAPVMLLAERGGFEPPSEFPPKRFSKPPRSAALPPLQVDRPERRCRSSLVGCRADTVAEPPMTARPVAAARDATGRWSRTCARPAADRPGRCCVRRRRLGRPPGGGPSDRPSPTPISRARRGRSGSSSARWCGRPRAGRRRPSPAPGRGRRAGRTAG